MYVTICIHIYILLIVMIVKLKKVDKLWSFPLVMFSGIDTVSMGSPAVGVIPSESYNSPSLTLKMTWFLPQMPFACAKLGLTEDGAQDEMQNSWSDGWGLVCGRGLSTCNLHCWLVSWAINMVGRTIWFIVDTYRLCSYTGDISEGTTIPWETMPFLMAQRRGSLTHGPRRNGRLCSRC